MGRIVWVFLGLTLLSACGDDSGEVTPDCSGTEACAVFELVNEERGNAGLEPYTYDGHLQRAAQLHAEDMVQNEYFSHTSQDGRDFATRAVEAGYTGSPRGENIAAGQRSADAVMQSWMNSSGHRANILSSGSTDIGIGFENNMWVQVFGTR